MIRMNLVRNYVRSRLIKSNTTCNAKYNEYATCGLWPVFNLMPVNTNGFGNFVTNKYAQAR